MTALASIVAWSAVSALGGTAEALLPRRGEAPRVALAADAELGAAGLTRPNVGRVAADVVGVTTLEVEGFDRAAALLGVALRDLTRQLDHLRPSWRELRVGLALGTSSGGMPSMQALFRTRAEGRVIGPALARRATYFGPVATALEQAALQPSAFAPQVQILAACAASTFAIGLGGRWLARGAADLVIAGGYDALSLLVAAGFECLRATTRTSPRPFHLERDGMSLGEGAGLMALVHPHAEPQLPRRCQVLGFGAATDAVHVTAPDREGTGLARAAVAALAEAGRDPATVAFVSAHATATPFNDAMESRAFARALGEAAPPVHPLKAQLGHTLGAAGALETIAAGLAAEAGLVPGAVLSGPLDPACPVRLLAETATFEEASPIAAASRQACVLKVSAAFGGSNAALVLGGPATDAETGGRGVLRPVYLAGRARVGGAAEARAGLEAVGVPPERLAKLDSLSMLACGAVAGLIRGGASIAGAGIVAGHALGTLDIDERFFSRLLARGAGAGEPRLFPATSPNVCAGHAAILFGLTGPSAATCGGLDGGAEALALAAELIAAGDADAVVVLAVDELGPAGQDILRIGFPAARAPAPGALAALLTATPGPGWPEVPLGETPRHDGPLVGHEALAARLDRLAG